MVRNLAVVAFALSFLLVLSADAAVLETDVVNGDFELAAKDTVAGWDFVKQEGTVSGAWDNSGFAGKCVSITTGEGVCQGIWRTQDFYVLKPGAKYKATFRYRCKGKTSAVLFAVSGTKPWKFKAAQEWTSAEIIYDVVATKRTSSHLNLIARTTEPDTVQFDSVSFREIVPETPAPAPAAAAE